VSDDLPAATGEPAPLRVRLTALGDAADADLAPRGPVTVLACTDAEHEAAVVVAAVVERLQEAAGARVHTLIATRSDPLLPLSRLRGRAQLTELSASDLRFTREEANAFLNQVMGLALKAEDVAALETRTEGWIVGLQMAAHALQGTAGSEGQTHDFISAFADSHRYILDYLTDEVLLREPEAVQAFLLRSSILERLSGPLCDAVRFGVDPAVKQSEPGASAAETETAVLDNGKRMMEALERDNLFVIPLDDKRHWYRYHHLFADVLQARLMDRVFPKSGIVGKSKG